jgi:hypothetical protein
MPGSPTKFQINLARLVIALLVVCPVIGMIVYGLSGNELQRVWRDLLERPTGPMALRMLLQPLMAAIAAVSDGIRDARAGRSPYFWTILSRRGERRELLFEGAVATARVLLAGLIMDTIYQVVFLKVFYPGEAAIVAILLCFIPYLLLRGPAARLSYWWLGKTPANSKNDASAPHRRTAGGARH